MPKFLAPPLKIPPRSTPLPSPSLFTPSWTLSLPLIIVSAGGRPTVLFPPFHMQIAVAQLVMVPDPDPADSDSNDDRHPSKLSAADQMCTRNASADSGPALYNHDQCGKEKPSPDPKDPKSEVRPRGLEQGDSQLANNTV